MSSGGAHRSKFFWWFDKVIGWFKTTAHLHTLAYKGLYSSSNSLFATLMVLPLSCNFLVVWIVQPSLHLNIVESRDLFRASFIVDMRHGESFTILTKMFIPPMESCNSGFWKL